MPFAGRSHFALIIGLGLWIVVVFVLAARWTRTTRRERLAALLSSAAAAAVNVATDSAAYQLGWWDYPEATTTFGPLLYYLEAGLGCGALALVARWTQRRGGGRAVVLFIAALGVYAPIRDWATMETTGLIEFHYDPLVLVLVADALSSFVIPVTVAYAALALIVPLGASPRSAAPGGVLGR